MTDTRQLLYLDTFSGISGDMFLGLLVDLGVNIDAIRAQLENLDLPDWKISTQREKRRGIEGCRVSYRNSGTTSPPDVEGHPPLD